MKINRFFKVPFWFLTLVPFYSHSIMASESALESEAQEKSQSKNFSPSVSFIIEKFKQNGFISEQQAKRVSTVEIHAFHGAMYYYGEGVPKNDTEAYKWFLSAALQNSYYAQEFIVNRFLKEASLHRTEKRVILDFCLPKLLKTDYKEFDIKLILKGASLSEDDKQEIADYIQEQAEQNHKKINLDDCLNETPLSEEHQIMILSSLHQTAEKGNSKAEKMLGRIYSETSSIVKNDIEASKWFLKGAIKGKAEGSKFILKQFKKKITNSLSERDKQEILYSLRQAVEEGNTSIQILLGYIYGHKFSIVKDYSEAYRWFEKLSIIDQEFAQECFEKLYEKGVEDEEDEDEEFLKWLTLRAEQNLVQDQFYLGQYYEKRNNFLSAIKWFTKAADQGWSDAQAALGNIYFPKVKLLGIAKHNNVILKPNIEDKYGNSQNSIEAFKWFTAAAAQDHYEGLVHLGYMYDYGAGTEKDELRALDLYIQAQLQKVCEIIPNLIENKIRKKDNFKTFSKSVSSQVPELQQKIKNILSSFEENPKNQFTSSVIQITDYLKNCVEVLNAFTQLGFMIDCLEFQNEELTEKSKTNPYIKSYVVDGVHYLTFGQANVTQADKLMDIFKKKDMPLKSPITGLNVQELIEIPLRLSLLLIKERANRNSLFLERKHYFIPQTNKTCMNILLESIEDEIEL